MDDEERDPVGGSLPAGESVDERLLAVSETLIRYVEVVAALVLVVLFAIGVFDLGLQIFQSAARGDITDPLVVVGFIDTALLLFIIVEVYQTVVAYTQESETRRIVRLVIYTGVIAMVRKAIIFRTGEYANERLALLAAVSYTVIIFGLVALLLVERRTRVDDAAPTPESN
ncbi:phosphate-starvation-inducible PsiE family protein [Haloarcula montana]|uniref:phosphate-starvation-inducible PsiE family protein n=1 Tax=Haloarcula montana TaxID=3111776 RepID=UPI002D779604|nr:phosphate-starvation-inducible PsiE family protein [Haloarcula sp. GH36]